MAFQVRKIGPGIFVAAAFIGPGTVTTATMAGAGYGYTLLWAIAFSIVATITLQEMSARLGVVTGMGVGDALRKKNSNKYLKAITFTLVILAIVIGNAAYEAGNLAGAVLGFAQIPLILGINPLIIFVGTITFTLLFIGRYKVIERFLILLVATMGIIFLFSALMLKPDIVAITQGLFIPVLPENASMMVLGLIGTTVVPYNLFLHASSVKEKWRDKGHLSTARWDTILSVIFGGIITMCILITSAIAFEESPTQINDFSDLSQQLAPILGNWSGNFMAFGFLAAGFSSSLTAPIAAAYATSEVLGWKKGFKNLKFRLIWIFVLLSGMILASLGYKPTAVILIAQVANSLILPLLAIYLLWIVNDRKIMGTYVNFHWVNLLGAVIVIITIILGIKGISSAFNII